MVDQAWNEDINLKDEMEKYARQGLMHEEALDFLKRFSSVCVGCSFPRQTYAIFSYILQ